MVACYLLLSMVVVAWLSLGVVYSVHAVLSSRAESQCLSLLGQAAAQAQIAYLRSGSESFPSLVEQVSEQNHLTYCAIVGTDGTYLAHTDPALVGGRADLPEGQPMSWGEVSAVQYEDDHEQTLTEFRVPLQVHSGKIGDLVIATPRPEFWSTALAAAEAAPPAVLVPLVLVIGGALLLGRLSQPLGGVETQLRHIATQPATAPPVCEKLPSRSAVDVGWNRLVDELRHAGETANRQTLTERVATAIQGRKQKASLEVLQNLSEGVAITDIEGRVTFANRAIAALLGETGQDATGAVLYDYLCGNVDDVDSLLDLSGAHPERSARAEVTRSHGDRRRVIRIERQPLQHGSEGHIWSLRDVTQQKLAEEMRGEFIDSATHELRTPLANIRAYSEMLAMMDDVDVEQQKEFCNTINSEATRLARFVDDLLSLSSMEVGAMSANRQNVDLERLFDEVAEKIAPLAAKKSQEFVVDLPEKLGEAVLDKDKFSAMVVNLLGNASKYTPEGGRIALEVATSEDELVVNVEDSGVGIAPEELPHVFDKFFRSSDPRVQTETGTGLGLSLASEIVRLHGGQLTVKSVVDKGSTFTATIPLRQEARL